MLHLAPEVDPTDAMANFRSQLPQYGANSWIVTP
jgi:hypothetical protein